MRDLIPSSAWHVTASAVTVMAASIVVAACVRPAPRATAPAATTADISQLWQEPRELAARDLRHGAGGVRRAPDPAVTYHFEEADRSGYSKGYEVTGPDGRRWNVKVGPEAQSEVVASRILWAIGYHQPAVYYLPRWTMSGEIEGSQEAGRFRPEDPDWQPVGEWSWYENDFVDTRPFKGLIAANLILNNWDLKTSNNRIVEHRANRSTERLYVVRDLGASLGRTTLPAWLNLPLIRMWKQGTRNNVADFESQNLIKRIDGRRIEFDYRGVNDSLVDTVSAPDVIWTCRLMDRISDAQWRDAFDAAGYSPEERERFVKKIKSKIGEGLALAKQEEKREGGTRQTGVREKGD